MGWIAFDGAYVLAGLPTEIAALYDQWIIDNPEKADRLGEIVDSVVADFRTGLSANPSVTLDAGENTLPERCVQHALTIVTYHLALEVGLSINMSAQRSFVAAQTYLRDLYKSDAVVNRDSESGVPSYSVDTERMARTLAGM
jgi:hypothetical protein